MDQGILSMHVSTTATASTSDITPSDGLAAKLRAPTKATRRIRGEIACAECRRLKIRCDRIVPCSTCIKRGCGALCPNGTIPPGEGSRFVLAATDHLRNKLTRMEARMRSLEDGLAIIQNSESDKPHPLLSITDDLDYDEENLLQPVQESVASNIPALRDACGTLWLDGQGGSRFFGPSGGSESLLLSSSVPETPIKQNSGLVLQELDPSYLSSDINQCYQAFPLTPPNIVSSRVLSAVEAFLPKMDRAIVLCDTFLEHLSWMFHIVSRQTLVHELIPAIYKQTPVSYGPHELALLIIVLGIGSLVDLNLPPYDLEAQHYYRLARATMTLQSVLGAQSVVTIKVLHLMSVYNGMSGKEVNLEQSYVLLDLAGQVALRIGLHIDPSQWGFSGREAYDRRVYFWNLMAGVLWQSLVTGRPPSLLTSYINCRIPDVQDEDLYQTGEVPLGFGIWGFKASAECLIPLARTTLAVKPPTYDAIIDLDRKIRNLALPQGDHTHKHNPDRTSISMRTFVRSHYQDLMLLYLHRAYFAQAMTEYPEDPLGSPYGQSVIAAYASACIVLEDTRAQFLKKPLLCARIWRIWSFTFTAAVIVGTVAIRGVHLELKPPALHELDTIYTVFSSAARTSNRAARALPVLHVMLQKAREAQQYYREQGEPAPPEGKGVDEFLRLGNDFGVIHRVPSESPPVLPLSQIPTTWYKSPTASPKVRPKSVPIPNTSLNLNAPSIATVLPIEPPLDYITEPSTSADDFLATRQIPSSYRNSYQAPQLKISTLPETNTFAAPQYQTFADISDGWGGLFHEVPSHPGHNQGYRRMSNNSHPQSGPLGQGISHEEDGVMLDDRWASFMNYDLLQRDPSQYQQ